MPASWSFMSENEESRGWGLERCVQRRSWLGLETMPVKHHGQTLWIAAWGQKSDDQRLAVSINYR